MTACTPLNLLLQAAADDMAVVLSSPSQPYSHQSPITIDNVNAYLPSVPFLLGQLRILTNSFLSDDRQTREASSATHKSTRTSKKSFFTALNERASSNIHFTNICSLLVDFHKYKVTVKFDTSPSMYLIFCTEYDESNDNLPRPSKNRCSRGFFSQRDIITRTPRCPSCRRCWALHLKREKRKTQNSASWVRPGSFCNWRYLAPLAQQQRRKNIEREKSTLKMKLSKLIDREKKVHLDSTKDVEAQVLKFIGVAGTVPKNIYADFRNDIIETLMAEIVDQRSNVENSKRSEVEEFVDETLSRIKNFKNICILGKAQKVRFSPQEIRLALMLYNRSPAGYREFRESSIQVWPTESCLKKYRAEIAISEGECPKMYGNFKDRLKAEGCYSDEGEEVHGELMVDEMKLQNGIYTNMISGDIVGFASSDVEFKSIRDDVSSLVRKMKNEEEDEEIKKDDGPSLAASYVNQFRFRSSKNKTASVEFFFNNGALSGDDLLYQLFHVLSMLNSVNIITHGLCLDAGGNNSGLLSMLRHGAKLGNVGWLDDDALVSFRDPTSNRSNHRIAVIHCATHNQKALRNAFLLSSRDKSSSRYFLSSKNVHFTWVSCVEECFLRDRINEVPVTNLDKSSTYPNAWNKMNVGHSLRPFTEKTLNEQFTHLGNLLHCQKDMYYSGIQDESNDIPSMHKKRLSLLKSALDSQNLGLEEHEVTEIEVKLAGLEYSVHVACIFNERFMNKKLHITLENIDKLESEMKESLDYFATWRTHAISRKTIDKDWEKGCISAQTFNNLRIQVKGFFTFSRYLLHADNQINFVPFLYSNQSSLESHFSMMRAMGADSPRKYISGIAALETRKVSRSLSMHKNKCYENGVEDCEEAIASTALEGAMKLTLSYRRKMVESWWTEGIKRSDVSILHRPVHVMDDQAFAKYFSSSFKNGRQRASFDSSKVAFDAVYEQIRQKMIPCDYRSYLFQNTALKEIAIASAASGSSAAQWLERLFKMGHENDLILFNRSCQQIVAYALVMFKNTCVVGDRSKHSSMWYQVYSSIDNGHMFGATGPFSCLPECLRSNNAGRYILLEKLITLLQKWMVTDKMESNKPSTTTNDPNVLLPPTDLSPNMSHPQTDSSQNMLLPQIDLSPNVLPTPTDSSLHPMTDLPPNMSSPTTSFAPNTLRPPTDLSDNQKKKINGFVGFAVAELIKRYHKKERTAAMQGQNSEREEYLSVIVLLKSMRILHNEALTNHQYMTDCYAETDKMLNHGGLTLISPRYFYFAHMLMLKCDEEMSEDVIYKRKNVSFKEARENVHTCQGLKELFIRSCNDSNPSSQVKSAIEKISEQTFDRVFSEILTKTIRSRFNAAMAKVRENTTGHYAAKSCKEAHRDGLKHDFGKRQMKVDGKLADVKIKKRKTEAKQLQETLT